MEISSAKRVKYAGVLHKSQGETYNKKEGWLTGLVTSCAGTAFSNTLLNGR